MGAIVRLRKTGAAVLALLLAVTGGAWTGAPVRAAGAEYTEYTEEAAEAADTAYIIKYKESAAWLMEDSDAHFELADRAEMERLRDAGLLEWYEPDGEAELLEAAAWYESEQWNLDLIHAAAAYEKGRLGQGVRVGVVDSGISPHPDLAGRLLPGRAYLDGAGGSVSAEDSYGHGTKVAGLIAGAGAHGYIGVAPEAQLVPLKVTDGKTVKISAVCLGIYGGIDDFGCSVLNLSLGVTSEYQSLQEAIAYAAEKNVTVVSAAGNAGKTGLYYPAAYDSVIGVGSVDQNGDWSAHSNHNDSVFLTAPGVNVRSTDCGGGYAQANGTSFAVPQVAGAAAVLLGIRPTLRPTDISRILSQTATDRGAAGYDEYYGYGILNLAGSIALLEQGTTANAETACSLLPADGPAGQIRNNTDRTIACTYLLADYDADGRFQRLNLWQFTIPAHGAAAVEGPGEAARYGQFVLETETLRPLAAARKG